MDICTCHISNLRCKDKKCAILISARAHFKTEVSNSLHSIFKRLHKDGFSRKDCIRALRREINHRNNIQFDLFEEVAQTIWGEKFGYYQV